MERKENGVVPFSMGWDALGINVQLAFPVLDELVKAVPGVVVLMHLKIVVEGLANALRRLSVDAISLNPPAVQPPMLSTI
jgi:hypothetical protein